MPGFSAEGQIISARIVSVSFRCLILLAFLLTRVAASQSVYTLEAIAADEFQPKEGFTEISGMFIDEHGNIAGEAHKQGRTVGFYWPTADSVRMLTGSMRDGQPDCEPRGIDEDGGVHGMCGNRYVIAYPGPRGDADFRNRTRNANMPGLRARIASLRPRTESKGGVTVGRTSPEVPISVCAALAKGDPYAGLGTVTAPGDGPSENRKITVILPSIYRDSTVTVMVPRGISPDGHAIVGVRDGVECVPGSSVTGRRAVMWTRSEGKWVASVLDQIPISLEVGLCAHDLRLEEANDVNDAGQITGKGTCADLDGNTRRIAYRLTPVSIRQP